MLQVLINFTNRIRVESLVFFGGKEGHCEFHRGFQNVPKNFFKTAISFILCQIITYSILFFFSVTSFRVLYVFFFFFFFLKKKKKKKIN